MTGTDLSLLVTEIQKAKDVLHKIQKMKLGLLGDKKIKIQHEVRRFLLWYFFKYSIDSLAFSYSIFGNTV